jgi:hypothetical protein
MIWQVNPFIQDKQVSLNLCGEELSQRLVCGRRIHGKAPWLLQRNNQRLVHDWILSSQPKGRSLALDLNAILWGDEGLEVVGWCQRPRFERRLDTRARANAE